VFFADQVLLAQLAYPGMVFRHLLQLAVAHAVDAAVTHVGRDDVVAGKHDGHDGCAHVLEGRVRVAAPVDFFVGGLDALAEQLCVFALVLTIAGTALERLGDGFNGDIGGDLTSKVTAHAVSHNAQTSLLDDYAGVLVVLALQTDICSRDHLHDHDAAFKTGIRLGHRQLNPPSTAGLQKFSDKPTKLPATRQVSISP